MMKLKCLKIMIEGDGLHPSPKGHEKMVEAINNLELFTKTFIKI